MSAAEPSDGQAVDARPGQAMPGWAARARAVVVLGMHRSGTSCLAGSLQEHGLRLGEVHVRDPYNRKGNRENDRIVALNDAVLAHSGGAWDAPPAAIRWRREHERERDEILTEFEAGAGPWGFKDPRVTLTLPFWQEPIAGRVDFVGAFRHPAQVVRSLCARGSMSLHPAHAAQLWMHYNERLLALVRSSPFPLVPFDLPSGEYRRRVDAIAAGLHLPGRPAGAAESFFDEELRGGRGAIDGIEVDGALLGMYEGLRLLADRGCIAA